MSIVESFSSISMEPPIGFRASLFQFLLFLPYFIGLLFLGFIKGMNFRVNLLLQFITFVSTFGTDGPLLRNFWLFYLVSLTKRSKLLMNFYFFKPNFSVYSDRFLLVRT